MSEPTSETLQMMWDANRLFGGTHLEAMMAVYAVAVAAHKAEQALQVQAEGLTDEQVDDLLMTLVATHADWLKAFWKALKDGVPGAERDEMPERKAFDKAYDAVRAILAAARALARFP